MLEFGYGADPPRIAPDERAEAEAVLRRVTPHGLSSASWDGPRLVESIGYARLGPSSVSLAHGPLLQDESSAEARLAVQTWVGDVTAQAEAPLARFLWRVLRRSPRARPEVVFGAPPSEHMPISIDGAIVPFERVQHGHVWVARARLQPREVVMLRAVNFPVDQCALSTFSSLDAYTFPPHWA